MNKKLLNIVNRNKEIYKDEIKMINLYEKHSLLKILEIENGFIILYRPIIKKSDKNLIVGSFVSDTNILDLNAIKNSFPETTFILNIVQEINQEKIKFVNCNDSKITLDCDAILYTKRNICTQKYDFSGVYVNKIDAKFLDENPLFIKNLEANNLVFDEYKTHDYISQFVNLLNEIKNGNGGEIYALFDKKSEFCCCLTASEDSIENIFTLPQKRNLGYAKILLNYYLKNIISENIKTIYYSVDNSKNIASIKLAESCGFECKGYKTSYVIE